MAGQDVPKSTNPSTVPHAAVPTMTSQDPSAMTKEQLTDLVNKSPPITRSAIPTLMGWPTSGGVWVLNPTQAQLEQVNRLPITTDMEEYCRSLERIGATFYRDPQQCEEVRATTTSMTMEDEVGVDRQFEQAPSERQNQ